MYLITWITTHLPNPEGWMAELAMFPNIFIDEIFSEEKQPQP